MSKKRKNIEILARQQERQKEVVEKVVKQQAPAGYYFQVVIYPEFTNMRALWEMGICYSSPIHYANQPRARNSESTEIIESVNFTTGHIKEYKQHKHILIKSSIKQTGNSFIRELLKHLHNDITGIAISKELIQVSKPEIVLRYFYHLDHPTKEHFDLYQAFISTPNVFIDDLIKAFDIEIRQLVTSELIAGNITSLNKYIMYKNGLNATIVSNWLCKGHNMYYVNSIIKENIAMNKHDFEIDRIGEKQDERL